MAKKLTMRFPDGRDRALTFSYDDGVFEDIRLVGLLAAQGLKGTFNLNSGLFADADATKGHTRLSRAQIQALYLPAGMEIAVHAYTHPDLRGLSREGVTEELMRDREVLESIAGTPVRGMAYPYGAFNDETVEIMRECGITYSRTVVSTHGFGLPADWLRLPATCHHNDPLLPELAERFLDGAPAADEDPWLFYVWGHSYEFFEGGNWDIIETFTARVSGKENVWYATNGEIYDYVTAWKQLVTTTDGSVLCNPTAADLWLLADGVPVLVPAGQTVRI